MGRKNNYIEKKKENFWENQGDETQSEEKQRKLKLK